MAARLGNDAHCRYVWYLVMQVYCWNLGVLYPFVSPDWSKVAGVIALLLAITALCLWQWRARPWLTFGWLWYLGTLVPVIGIVQVGDQAYADRYTYLPQVGLLIMGCDVDSSAVVGVCSRCGGKLLRRWE